MKRRLALSFTVIAFSFVVISCFLEQVYLAIVSVASMLFVGLLALVILQRNSAKILERTLAAERSGRESKRLLGEIRNSLKRSGECLEKTRSNTIELLNISRDHGKANSQSRLALDNLNRRTGDLLDSNVELVDLFKAYQRNFTAQLDESAALSLRGISALETEMRSVQSKTTTAHSDILRRVDAISRQIRDQVVASSSQVQDYLRKLSKEDRILIQEWLDEVVGDIQIVSKKQISQVDAIRGRLDSLTATQISSLSDIQANTVAIEEKIEFATRNQESVVVEYRENTRKSVMALREDYEQLLKAVNFQHENLKQRLVQQSEQCSQAVSDGLRTTAEDLVSEQGKTLANVQKAISEAKLSNLPQDISSEVMPLIDLLRDQLEKNVQKIVESQRRESSNLTKIIWDETRQVHALLQLSDRMHPRWTMPPFGRWALDARSAMHLLEIVEQLKPSTIVELGSGTSSVLLGYLSEKYNASVSSFDHLSEFAEITREMLSLHGLEDTVSVKHAALESTIVGGDDYQWYSTDAFDDIEKIDLLVVDGPPGGVGNRVRYPAVPVLAEKLNANSVVILDDSDRPDEADILAAWMKEFPTMKRIHTGISRLAVLAVGDEALAALNLRR